MIVYNAGRRWFDKKADAEKHRVLLGHKPGHTLAITVSGREDLCSLLNALCEPPSGKQAVPPPATPELVDRAYVTPDHSIPDYVPRFLLDDEGKRRWDAMHLNREGDRT